MLIFFLALGFSFLLSLLLYQAAAYKARVDVEEITHIVQRACDEIDTVLVQENEPPKAEYKRMTHYSCTRCGNVDSPQQENPFPVTHPLGRYCSTCLPLLLDGIQRGLSPKELIAEGASTRRSLSLREEIGRSLHEYITRANEPSTADYEGMLLPYPEMK